MLTKNLITYWVSNEVVTYGEFGSIVDIRNDRLKVFKRKQTQLKLKGIGR
jgi:hypothetical protein